MQRQCHDCEIGCKDLPVEIIEHLADGKVRVKFMDGSGLCRMPSEVLYGDNIL